MIFGKTFQINLPLHHVRSWLSSDIGFRVGNPLWCLSTTHDCVLVPPAEVSAPSMMSHRLAFISIGSSFISVAVPVLRTTGCSAFVGRFPPRFRQLAPKRIRVSEVRFRAVHTVGSGSQDASSPASNGTISSDGGRRPPPVTKESGFSTDDDGGTPGIISSDLRQEMSRSYMEYAMSVILGRALPDLRDGLKPVHRRILYAMHGLGIGSTGQYRKCARVVGEVLGKYHPHGDTAVYDALVRMAQPFSMAVPLIDGHGNFGSTDGDSAAAMRYTECRLAPLSKDALLEDLTRDTVDFGRNFDGSEHEPLVLPTRIPNLFLNGSSGIAVGMATNIPPHNLGELVNATVALIRDPALDDDEMMRLLPGPDFPTGGQILGTEGARDLYLTGKGRIMMRAAVHFETLDNASSSGRRVQRQAIVVTDLPYQVNKSLLVERIAELVNSKKLEGISDLRDESDRDGTRIVIELKRDAGREVVLNNLYKKTALQHAFSGNVLALDGGRSPVRLTLRDYLTKFIEFRREVVRRRVQFELNRAKARWHVVTGFIIAQNAIDDVIAIIRGSPDGSAALAALQSASLGLSEIQAEAVLGMQLRRLTSLERGALESEARDLELATIDYTSLLEDARRVDEVIIGELHDESRKHAKKRRSTIVLGSDLDAAEIDELSLIANEQCVIVMTQMGMIKRMRATEFENQNRGTRGKHGVGNQRGSDVVRHFFTCHTHDMLVAISKRGIAYDLPAHKVPIGARTSRGVPLFQLIPLIGAGETMASILPVSEFRDDEYLALLTKNGLVKKTALSAFRNMNVRGKIIIGLREGDELKWVRRCLESDSMIIASARGFALRTSMSEGSVRASGRGTHGVKAMALAEGDEIADMDILHGIDSTDDSRYVLAVTSDGLGKRVEASRFRTMGRTCRGNIAIKFRNESTGRVIALQACNDGDSVMLVTNKGTIVRQEVSSITARSRAGRPVLLQRLDPGDEVAAVTIVPPQLSAVAHDDDIVEL
jgi:DNA gyrase subunit A